MELQVAPPMPPADFIFDSTCSSPSSPRRLPNLFFSAPASPTPTVFPDAAAAGDIQDFEFDFSGHLQRTSLSADELFDGGKIRPLKPPPSPRLKSEEGLHSSSSTRSKGKKIIQDRRDFGSDSFEKTRKLEDRVEQEQQKRGRSGRASSFSYSSENSGRKGSRSAPPFRISDADDVSDQDLSQAKATSSSTSNTKSSHASFLSSLSFSKGYRKWRIKDFLLFRSASEGRAAGKDPLTKYAVLSKKAEEEVRNSSFRSTESLGSVSSRRRGAVSPHELHYTVNRAASEEMKKKTVLPYKQLGPLGCLGFNPSLHRIIN
ncbi:uncharacterized protein LOC114745414 [Neltuma alba]|uniref:uncharacterized protein LOC114745414 n=1 Tax=Neltuma alba TaxID=207710 RepID=UPI0010A488B5|nr:uncharacterized protein LOC114745414 [Prosopis alba]